VSAESPKRPITESLNRYFFGAATHAVQ
jgi:hypothetical protein